MFRTAGFSKGMCFFCLLSRSNLRCAFKLQLAHNMPHPCFPCPHHSGVASESCMFKSCNWEVSLVKFVTQLCRLQPFVCGRYLWMHNGGIGAFHLVRRALLKTLRDDVYQQCPSFESDSAVSFALFLNQVGCVLMCPIRAKLTSELLMLCEVRGGCFAASKDAVIHCGMLNELEDF
jgi:hypothetical protein